ncbi:molybdenum cofactor guanylyltransferase [Cohnella faecalis]|uniref:MobA-like NTP transferase domain-containing protein n=1 Tax=Cohnella faecalis TaxID=2315694 RepID=A0A398CQH7_9BACL|nr:nucleotidyltransferase family protein [Cohnella faecalis]RIE03048.1 hypothetical protein D3H35_20895 [Cohnella faecalis]
MRKSAVLLAGGAGRRMGGVNKAQLTLGAETFIERQIRIVSQWADEIVVVTNDEAFASSLTEAASDLAANSPPGPVVRTTPDLFVREGPLAGLHAGLSAASHRLVWLLGCDQPAPDPRAAAWLADRLASVNGGEQGRFAAELPNGPERNAAAVRHLAALPRIGEDFSRFTRFMTATLRPSRKSFFAKESAGCCRCWIGSSGSQSRNANSPSMELPQRSPTTSILPSNTNEYINRFTMYRMISRFSPMQTKGARDSHAIADHARRSREISKTYHSTGRSAANFARKSRTSGK